MVEINYIKCVQVPFHPSDMEALDPDLYERINDYTVVLNEGVRVLLISRPQTEEEILNGWLELKKLKEADGGD